MLLKDFSVSFGFAQFDAYIRDAGQQVAPHDVANADGASRADGELQRVNGHQLLTASHAFAKRVAVGVVRNASHGVDALAERSVPTLFHHDPK